MRWERLFADLESQWAAAETAEIAAEVADRTRLEVARIRWADRLAAAVGADVTVGVAGAGAVSGTVARVGPDWVLVRSAAGEVVVPTAAVGWLRGLPAHSADRAAGGVVASRLDLRYLLRGLARDRATVRLLLVDGTEVAGTIDRVGADFLDLAEHAADEPRRAAVVHAARTVVLSALAAVRLA